MPGKTSGSLKPPPLATSGTLWAPQTSRGKPEMGFPVGSKRLLHPSLMPGEPHCGVTHQPWAADAGHQTTAAVDAPQKLPLCASTTGMVTQGPVTASLSPSWNFATSFLPQPQCPSDVPQRETASQGRADGALFTGTAQGSCFLSLKS